jgi:hypothetical protein
MAVTDVDAEKTRRLVATNWIRTITVLVQAAPAMQILLSALRTLAAEGGKRL